MTHSPVDDLQHLRKLFDAGSLLSGNARSVAAVLILRRNGKTGQSNPSVPTIAAQARISERAVYRALVELEEAGAVSKATRRGMSTMYQVHPPTPATQSGVTESQGCHSVRGGVTESQGTPATQSPKRTRERTKERTDPVQGLWDVYVEELDGERLTLTKTRRKKLEALHAEQLQEFEDPEAEFRKILQAVKASDHHMGERAYQLPESLFRNVERRERWSLKAQENGRPSSGADALTLTPAELREREASE